MSRYTYHITSMARGESGRIVIEVEPEMKRRLYAALALTGSTLKDWFIRNAELFCDESTQPPLFEETDISKATSRGASPARPGWRRAPESKAEKDTETLR